MHHLCLKHVGRQIHLFGLLFLLVVAGIDPARALDAAARGTPYGTPGGPQAHVRVPAGLTRAIDPAGYRLVSGTHEPPRLVSSSTTVAQWIGFGGIHDGCNGGINAVVKMTNGDLAVAGDFTLCGNVTANHVALWNGTAWSSLGTANGNGVDGVVRALTAIGSDLYVGGDFTEAGGAAANFIARWDGGAWSSLGAGADNGMNQAVLALAAIGTDVYAGGFFNQAGGATAHGIARWDGNAWNTLGTGAAEGVQYYVYALTTIGTDLYVGGSFDVAGGLTAVCVARWNGTAWSSLGTGYPGVNNPVYALTAIGTDLYAAGNFSQAGGVPAKNIAHWDGSTWNSLGTGTGNGVDAEVHALAAIGTDLYVGGNFTNAGGAAANYIARWDGGAWNSVGTGNENGVHSFVAALAAIGADLYVSGDLSRGGTVAANGIARWNGSAWNSLGDAAANGLNAGVASFATIGTDLYVAGDFTQAGNVSAYGIARWHDGFWSTLDSGLGFSSGVVGRGHALAAIGTDLFVGGVFNQAGGTAANYIARWNGSVWSSLGAGGANGVNSSVYAIAAVGTDLYVGGDYYFSQAGGVSANHIARWDGSTWSSLGDAANNGVDSGSSSYVAALAANGTDLYVGGNFSHAGGVAAHNIAKWDGSAWSALGAGVGDVGYYYPVYVLATVGSDLYAGGAFVSAGGTEANHIARWDGSNWISLGTGASNGVNGDVSAIASIGSDVYVGGSFTLAGGVPANGIARWDGTAWSSLGIGRGNGVSGNGVGALTAVETALYVGGSFGEAGGQVSSNIAKVTLVTDEVFGNGFEGPPGDPCGNLGRISVGNTIFKWSLQGSGTVTYGDNTTANSVPFTSYTSIWNEGSANPWPGANALNVRLGLVGTVYLAEAFSVPVDGSVSGTIKWLNDKSGVGYSAASNAASYAISVCAGDVGQPGTQLGPNCTADIASTAGLAAVVSSTPVAGACTLTPGKTYYLNLLQAPLAGIAATSAAFSSCSSNCAPWTARQ